MVCMHTRTRICVCVCKRERDFLITVDLFAKTYPLLQEGKVCKTASCVLHCSTTF